jgi:type IV pilus assembly protein PilW
MIQLTSKWPDDVPNRLRTGAMPWSRQRGFTMVELLVALVLSLLIALAAISALIVTRQGFNTVDAASQLRDNGRFAADLIQRLAVQSGFEDLRYAATSATSNVVGAATNPEPNVKGYNNTLADSTDPLNTYAIRTTGADGYGSDVLILRNQSAETYPGSGIIDKSLIDCAGNPAKSLPTDRYDQMISIFQVALSQGEQSLMCIVLDTTSGAFSTQPIVQGVENFQVLYGTDGVTAGVAPTAIPTTVPDHFLRADQLTVAGDPIGTNANWRRVRSLRIGMVLRGPLNSAQEKVAQTLYPFGLAKSSSTGTAGAAMSSADDPGTVFTTPADGRLRQVVTFTVHLRNNQNL